jgi:glycine/D-amino acid oxidase-like deaminating enzyme
VYDLIIIGGGMSGISVAYQFRDQNILLLEKGDLLAGATGNNAGFLITGFAEHFDRTAQRWGITRAREIQEIHEASHRKIRALTNFVEEGGSYSIAFSQKEAQDLRASYESMLGEGFPVEWVEAPPV